MCLLDRDSGQIFGHKSSILDKTLLSWILAKRPRLSMPVGIKKPAGTSPAGTKSIYCQV
jgi:hypothetical protein